MHQYIEAVRTELEIAAGAESYLAGALFMRLQNSLAYEDDGEERLHNRDGYELVQHKAINCLKSPHELDLNQEVLSWQAALLRHGTKEFYHWWIQYKNQKFQGPDFFADGEGCMAIESACEKIGGNPTENFTLILEIEHLLVKLTTGPGKMLNELKRFWEFKRVNQTAQTNPFTVKRIQVEQAGTQIAKINGVFLEIAERFERNGKKVAGAHHLMWMNAALELKAMSTFLSAFLDYQPSENLEAGLSGWINSLFPARLKDNTPNPLCQSELHHQVNLKLTQATQMMLLHVLKKEPVFEQRDQIMIPFVLEQLEAIKRTSLLGAASQPAAQEQVR